MTFAIRHRIKMARRQRFAWRARQVWRGFREGLLATLVIIAFAGAVALILFFFGAIVVALAVIAACASIIRRL